jgi:hypothetical protein
MAASELVPIIITRLTGQSVNGQAVSTANMVEWDSDTGFYIDVNDTARIVNPDKMVIFITNASSASTDGAINALSSTLATFTGSGIPDMDIDLTTATGVFEGDTTGADHYMTIIGPLESARFLDSDGYFNFEYDTDHAGMVTVGRAWAIVLP